MEIILTVLQTYPEYVVGFIAFVAIVIYTIAKRELPQLSTIEKITGISYKVLAILLEIFKSTERNHITYNKEVLKGAVDLAKIPDEGKQKMAVAIEAIKASGIEKSFPKVVKKLGGIEVVATIGYHALKHIFKPKKG